MSILLSYPCFIGLVNLSASLYSLCRVWDTHPSKVASGERKKLYTFYIDSLEAAMNTSVLSNLSTHHRFPGENMSHGV
jgi:hypothetical protein